MEAEAVAEVAAVTMCGIGRWIMASARCSASCWRSAKCRVPSVGILAEDLLLLPFDGGMACCGGAGGGPPPGGGGVAADIAC